MTQSLAYSIKRLREVLQARYKMTNLTTQDVVRVEFQSAVHFPEAIQTINALVELVAEMRGVLGRVSSDYNGIIKVCRHYSLNASYKDATESKDFVDGMITKADALLTKLKE